MRLIVRNLLLLRWWRALDLLHVRRLVSLVRWWSLGLGGVRRGVVSLSWALVWRRLVRRARMRLVVMLLHLAGPGMLGMMWVVVWRWQALGRVGVMLLGECGQQRCLGKQRKVETRQATVQEQTKERRKVQDGV